VAHDTFSSITHKHTHTRTQRETWRHRERRKRHDGASVMSRSAVDRSVRVVRWTVLLCTQTLSKINHQATRVKERAMINYRTTHTDTGCHQNTKQTAIFQILHKAYNYNVSSAITTLLDSLLIGFSRILD